MPTDFCLAHYKPGVLRTTEIFVRPTNNLRFNFVLFRDYRTVALWRVGIAIAVMTCIGYDRVVFHSRQNIEGTITELSGVVVLALKPPGSSRRHPGTLFGAHGKVVLAGDLNCKHPDWSSNFTTTTSVLWTSQPTH